MASLAEALGERLGPLPAWAWAAGGGAALYLLVRRRSTTATTTQGNPTFSPFAGGQGALFGSPAALVGPVLQLNPNPTQPTALQSGAALNPNSTFIPTPTPPVGGAGTGGDNPFVTGYTGLRPTNYNLARGGPS